MTLVVGGLFAWGFLDTQSAFVAGIAITAPAAVTAGLTLLISLILYVWAPKKHYSSGAFISFALLTIFTGILVYTTGQTHSPFLALWMLVGAFTGAFGLYGMGLFIVLAVAYGVLAYTQMTLEQGSLVVMVITSLAPLIVSYLLWHTGSHGEDEHEVAYQKLATELQQVAGKSDVVINAIADGVIAVDADGVIELFNPAAQSIIGWGKQDALKLSYKSVLKLVDSKNEELTEANDPVAQVLANNRPVTTNKFTLVTNSGKNLIVSLVISPVGQIGSGAIIVFRDVTKETAEGRQQAEFISTASHEMRTPVASIEGYLGLALNPATATIDDKARDFIQKAHESAQHLGRLFQDLLDVSKADDGRMQNNPKVINVVEFLFDIVEGLRPKATEKQLTLLYKPKPDDDRGARYEEHTDRTIAPIFYVNVDPDHLREVAANLIENAIKYTLRGNVVIDVSSGDNDSVQISVQDSGIGIPPEDIGHLFQKFYRVDNSATREIGGTGLGLYLCRRLCEAMNGRIWVESEWQHGSTFFVSLPRISPDEANRMIEQSANEAETAPSIIGPAHVSPAQLTPAAPTTFIDPSLEAPSLSPAMSTATSYTDSMQTPLQTFAPPIAQPTTPQADTAPLAARRVNTPLTTIEQNTAQYIQQTMPTTPVNQPQNVPPEQKP